MDSLGAVELRNAISARFAINLPATVAFDYPTTAALARFVAQQAAGRAAVPMASIQQVRAVPGH